MRKHSTAAPALPTAALASSHSSVKTARNNTKVEALPEPEQMHDELRLLRQIVEEARSFRRPDQRERQDSQQQPALPTAKPQADIKPLTAKSEDELVLLRKIIKRSKRFSQTVSENRAASSPMTFRQIHERAGRPGLQPSSISTASPVFRDTSPDLTRYEQRGGYSHSVAVAPMPLFVLHCVDELQIR